MPLRSFQLKPTDPGASGLEWTAERLSRLVLSAAVAQVMVVSCRQPCSHEHTAEGLRWYLGRAHGWVGGASFLNAHGACQVPPQKPEHPLRRVWLEDDEKRHFLDGFANDSMWPMCHRCDVEPAFRASDWRHHQRVNERFAQAVISVADCRSQVLRDNGLAPPVRLIAGIDRFDHTKGLLDKVRAVESLLDRHPHWRGLVSLVQIATPTRSDVPAYAAYQDLVHAQVDRTNRRLGSNGVLLIVLLATQHDRDAICRLYRAACVCAVTSLHDGMNLVSRSLCRCATISRACWC